MKTTSNVSNAALEVSASRKSRFTVAVRASRASTPTICHISLSFEKPCHLLVIP
jgi:hypothetical protein